MDAGLAKDDLDGLIVGPPLAYERTAEVLGIEPRWGGSGDAVGALLKGVLAIAAGLASTVALVYGNDLRSVGTAYGGPNAMGGEAILSYVYYAPWGMTSQGALYAMMTQRYMQLHGVSSADLGQVAMAERQFASMNPNAIMRSPITIDDYLSAPFITEPLRLFDYCLINDGGVALILTTRDRAARAPTGGDSRRVGSGRGGEAGGHQPATSPDRLYRHRPRPRAGVQLGERRPRRHRCPRGVRQLCCHASTPWRASGSVPRATPAGLSGKRGSDRPVPFR